MKLAGRHGETGLMIGRGGMDEVCETRIKKLKARKKHGFRIISRGLGNTNTTLF